MPPAGAVAGSGAAKSFSARTVPAPHFDLFQGLPPTGEPSTPAVSSTSLKMAARLGLP